MRAYSGKKKIVISVSLILLVVFSCTLFGCNTKKATASISKQNALSLLNSSVKKDGNSTFIDYPTRANKFKWDDGSYYAFYLKDKASTAMNDLKKVYVVHKRTKNIYQLDLLKNASGHVIKKYTNPMTSVTSSKPTSKSTSSKTTP